MFIIFILMHELIIQREVKEASARCWLKKNNILSHNFLLVFKLILIIKIFIPVRLHREL